MAKANTARKSRKSGTANQITLRHLWLAGLGLAAVGRREALATRGRLLDQAQSLQQRVAGLVRDTRGQVEPQVVKFSQDVEARLAPVLDKLGLKPRVRPARKPRKAATRAKAPARRPARKPAQKRTARKA